MFIKLFYLRGAHYYPAPRIKRRIMLIYLPLDTTLSSFMLFINVIVGFVYNHDCNDL